MAADAIITKRLHVSGLTPAITSDVLKQRLATFGTVKCLDGLGKLDSLGQPRKFAYATLEGTKAQMARCVNALSGSTWKGAKLRIGDAKPDYKEKIAKEAVADPAPPRKKRKRTGGVEAADMSLVTPTNVVARAGWKVTTVGRMVRPMRMRPAHPLPPPAESALRRNLKKARKDTRVGKDEKEKKKRKKEPDVRARRRTIDPLRWGSVQLKGMFLDVITAPREGAAEANVEDMIEPPLGEETSSTSGSQGEDDELIVTPVNITVPILPPPPAPVSSSSPITPKGSVPAPVVAPIIPASAAASETDLLAEKQSSLSLLHSLFSGNEDWGGSESVGSDIDEEEVERLKREGVAVAVDGGDVEEVPMQVDGGAATTRGAGSSGTDDEMEVQEMVEPDVVSPVTQEAQKTKLKDLFAPREEEAGFSLLGHLDLDLDLELDDEIDIPDFIQALPAASSEPAPTAFTVSTITPSSRTSQFIYDPTLPMFFPLPSTFSRPLSLLQSQNQTNPRVRDNFIGLLPEAAAFHRTDTEEQIRARWEESKGELTREWKRRFREAGKSRRRRGGGDGD